MQTPHLFRKPSLAAIFAFALLGLCIGIPHHASAEGAQAESSADLEQILFVQIMPVKNGPTHAKEAYTLSWIPAPLQKYCLGKPFESCSSMDYCLRTTNRDVSMCRKLGSALAHMPAYPPNMAPRRMISITLFPPSTMKGFDLLQKLAGTMPHSSPQLFSMTARVKARVRLTRKPDDDDFSVLEILAASPF